MVVTAWTIRITSKISMSMSLPSESVQGKENSGRSILLRIADPFMFPLQPGPRTQSAKVYGGDEGVHDHVTVGDGRSIVTGGAGANHEWQKVFFPGVTE
jgi:hypothetical protein